MLSNAILSLLKDSNKMFYGYLLQAARRIPDPNLPAAAGVNVTDGINLYYNPLKWGQLSPTEQVAVLEHEVMHIVFDHVLKSRHDGLNPKMWNFAVDMVVNQYIVGLPDWVVTCDKFGLPRGENAEWYYAKLQKMSEDKKDKAGGNVVDDHSKWGEGSAQDNPEGARALVDDAIKTAENRAGAGNIPQHLQSLLNNYGKSTISWKTVLRQFVYASINSNKKKTRKRVNRRYGTIYPGKKKDVYAHIAVAMDTSGSVSEDSLNQYLKELNAIHRALPIKLTMIQADCVVTDVSEFDPKKKITISGRGGTAYQPAFDKAKELKVDACIYFGDMDCADTPIKPRYPVLWATVQGGTPPVKWGKVISVT